MRRLYEADPTRADVAAVDAGLAAARARERLGDGPGSWPFRERRARNWQIFVVNVTTIAGCMYHMDEIWDRKKCEPCAIAGRLGSSNG